MTNSNGSESKRCREAQARLAHLLALARLRLKLEPGGEVASTIAEEFGLKLDNPGYLDAHEIAAACQLRVATVRNAVSRREVHVKGDRGVEIGEALDWMVQRRGFLYPTINLLSTERRINGLLANRQLHADERVEALRQVSRLRLSLWKVRANGRCFGINAEGLHQCLLTLPANDIDTLMGCCSVHFEDRSEDPSIRLYRQSFQSAHDPILQAVIPNMASLNAVVGCLAGEGIIGAAAVDEASVQMGR
ncbi:hypothetical protein [Halomonas sp. TA6]|uniref:hypothetical protein n=1 Tax=Halomonas sp. TA6 TaxID=2730854 RepID=UPI001ABF9D5A|nr:hypothetical protein [Halomonas sp. TA6]